MTLRPLIAALLTLPLTVAAQTTPHLIPMPREIQQKPDVPLNNGVQIICPACDNENLFAANDLRQTLADRGIATTNPAGYRIVFQQHVTPPFPDAMQPEGYAIVSANNTSTLIAMSSAGIFYAAQTIKQLIDSPSPNTFVLHAADIRDYPALKYRGLHDDLSRGPVPTLAFQKHLIQQLAAYKINLYSPYFEETQQYASNPLAAPPGGSISASDARELVAFAAQYHIMVVPEQEAFGHLRHMLTYEQYSPLAETPHGAVLAPGQPVTLPLISQMFTELANLYPSPVLHIGGDETVDLGTGQSRADVDARGLGPVYLDFVSNIVTTLQPLHRRILFWGDIAQDSPDLLKAMPQSFKDQTIAIAWGYSPNPKGFDKQLHPFIDAGIETWVAPAINNYRQVYPNQQLALDDIQEFTRDGQRLGATGQLNTLWNDDGESLADQNWYGILFGAAAAWQPGESSIPQFQQSFAQVFHGDQTGLLNQAQIELTTAMTLIHDGKVVSGTEGTDGLFWIDPWTKDGEAFNAKLRPIASDVRLHAERAITLIAQARAAAPAITPGAPSSTTASSSSRVGIGESRPLFSPPGTLYAPDPDPANAFPSNPTTLREPNAIDAMEFGARRIDFLVLKFQLADEMVSSYTRALTTAASGDRKARPSVASLMSDINGVNGRIQDITSGYSQLRDLYAQTWLRTNRPYALRRILEHYDAAAALWLSRMDKFRIAQREWSSTRNLLSATDAGIGVPATATTAPVAQVVVVQKPAPKAKAKKAPAKKRRK